MTTEEDFQTALDAEHGDWQTRLVFADWLEERGDPRADGYRALGTLRLLPIRASFIDPAGTVPGAHIATMWYYMTGSGQYDRSKLGRLWHHAFECRCGTVGTSQFVFSRRPLTRRECDDLAALAWGDLTDAQRADATTDLSPD